MLQPEPEGGGEGEMVIKVPDPLDELPNEDATITAKETVEFAEKVPNKPTKEEKPFDRIEVKAYPNPFSTEVNFEVTTPEEIVVSFEFYNALGARVGGIANQDYVKGKTVISYDGSHLAPGMYLCKVRIGEETETIRLAIVR